VNATVQLPPADELGALNVAQLRTVLDVLFERGDLLVPMLVGVSFTDWGDVLRAATDSIGGLPPATQVELLRGHARLGEDPRILARGNQVSLAEQGAAPSGSGDNDHVSTTRHELLELGELYEERFGFPFVEFVAGRPLDQIVPVLRQRLTNSPEVELQTALQAMVDIAASRVAKFTNGGSMTKDVT
jgi:2-oxo-4-hydroxy-4-carboxy--5-ureidoimidazoline (OHCU) decarboxylase